MITNPADYQQLLYQLEDENFPIKYPSLPSPEDEALIKINLQTKKIENTNNYVTIEGDHAAETLYFEVNRYHGLVDLSNMMCILMLIMKSVFIQFLIMIQLQRKIKLFFLGF